MKGVRREAKRNKLRYGMRVDNAGVRRVQLSLIQAGKKPPKP